MVVSLAIEDARDLDGRISADGACRDFDYYSAEGQTHTHTHTHRPLRSTDVVVVVLVVIIIILLIRDSSKRRRVCACVRVCPWWSFSISHIIEAN